nr:MAG TPA: hypothetical protein [Caudoviricetes sp.]
MLYFKDYVTRYNIDNQLPYYKITARDNILVIDGLDYRICTYGWPDNRVTVANKITGVNTIKRFGSHGRDKCESYLRSCLEILGVEFPEEE